MKRRSGLPSPPPAEISRPASKVEEQTSQNSDILEQLRMLRLPKQHPEDRGLVSRPGHHDGENHQSHCRPSRPCTNEERDRTDDLYRDPERRPDLCVRKPFRRKGCDKLREVISLSTPDGRNMDATNTRP